MIVADLRNFRDIIMDLLVLDQDYTIIVYSSRTQQATMLDPAWNLRAIIVDLLSDIKTLTVFFTDYKSLQWVSFKDILSFSRGSLSKFMTITEKEILDI